MKKHDPLYFLAIVPPEPIKSDLQKLKEDFSREYKCKAALKSPPHITLHMPFRFPEKNEKLLIEKLKNNVTVSPFEVTLDSFGCFQPRVIYINVEPSDELHHVFREVEMTMKSINVFNAEYKNRGFNPHLTIAFRDLKKSIFPVAWAEFRERKYSSSFKVDSYCLLKHNGKRWEEYHSVMLQ